MSEEGVLVCDVGECVDADCAGLKLSFLCPIVEGLDVSEDVLELIVRLHGSGSKPPKHEGVVGVRRVAKPNFH